MSVLYSRFLAPIFRAVFRLVLLLRNKSGLQTSPPIIPLDRGVDLTQEGPFFALLHADCCRLICCLSIFFCIAEPVNHLHCLATRGHYFPPIGPGCLKVESVFPSSSDDVTLEEQDEHRFVGQRSGRTIRPLGSCESTTFMNLPLPY